MEGAAVVTGSSGCSSWPKLRQRASCVGWRDAGGEGEHATVPLPFASFQHFSIVGKLDFVADSVSDRTHCRSICPDLWQSYGTTTISLDSEGWRQARQAAADITLLAATLFAATLRNGAEFLPDTLLVEGGSHS